MTDYRDIIKQEFLRRRQSEPFYSMRRFAKDLGLKPMHLSYLLRGERGLSKEKAAMVANTLGLKSYAIQRFIFLASAKSGRSRYERNLAKTGLTRKYLAIPMSLEKNLL